MGKTSHLTTGVAAYTIMLMVLGISFCPGNASRILAGEKPSPTFRHEMKFQDDKNKKADTQTISNENVKLFLRQIEIYGQIAKPQTVFIISSTDPRVDGLRIDRHFFTHIFRPVEKSTLRRIRIKQGKDKDHILW